MILILLSIVCRQVLYPWTKLSGLARFAIIINSLAATVFLISLLVSSSGVCGATMEYKKTVGRSTRNSQHRIFQMKLFQEFAELESKHGANQPVEYLSKNLMYLMADPPCLVMIQK
jgi:hypothetical protein